MKTSATGASPINYVQHLNAFMSRAMRDPRLAPPHISLYLELFRQWNLNWFQNPVLPVRGETMKLSKIKSRTTYRKIIHELHKYGYIHYIPSHHASATSEITILLFTPDTGQQLTRKRTKFDRSQTRIWPQPGQNLVPSINNTNVANMQTADAATQTQKNDNVIEENNNHPVEPRPSPIPTSPEEVQAFFRANGADIRDATRFFNHYTGIGWRIGGRIRIRDWQPIARNWILGTTQHTATQPARINTHVLTEKKYDEPL